MKTVVLIGHAAKMITNMSLSNLSYFPIIPNQTSSFSTLPLLSNRNPRFLDESILEDGLDPVDYIKQVRTRQRKKKRRKVFFYITVLCFKILFCTRGITF